MSNSVITIGKFDGVHLGHKKLINRVCEIAKCEKYEPLVITFDYLPPQDKNIDYKLLTTSKEKRNIINGYGIKNVIELPFDEEIKNMEARFFVENVLIKKYNMKHLVVGSDFSFGKDRKGDISYLKDLSREFNFFLEVVEKVRINEEYVSSTLIKTNLLASKISLANEMLGYDYVISGITKAGNKLGRKLKVPTLNIYPDYEKALPKFGVYAAITKISDKYYKSVVNIGIRPTIEISEKVSVETHLLEYFEEKNEERYGEEISISLKEFIREEEKFSSYEELIDKMKIDVINASKILEKVKVC